MSATDTTQRPYGMSTFHTVRNIPDGCELVGVEMRPDDFTRLWFRTSAGAIVIRDAEWADSTRKTLRPAI